MADNNRPASTVDHSSSSTIADSLQKSNALKVEGNDHFRAGRWREAIAAYESALLELPKTVSAPPQVPPPFRENTSSEGDENESSKPAEGVSTISESSLLPAEANECAKARAILNANSGACYVKLGDHQKAVEACSQALYDDPKYLKALQRRAASNEALDSWSSLTAAQEDYITLSKLLPASSSEAKVAERSLLLLKPRIEAAQKRETGEMLDKLKGLGNSILGNFGLSTDNFKFEPNGQGGYSMNFSQ